jgi:hypothetical protein
MIEQKIESRTGWVSFLSKNGSILMSAEAGTDASAVGAVRGGTKSMIGMVVNA